MFKTCTKCGKVKDSSFFYKYKTYCKGCQQKENREKLIKARSEISDKVKAMKEKYKNGIPEGTVEYMADVMILRISV